MSGAHPLSKRRLALDALVAPSLACILALAPSATGAADLPGPDRRVWTLPGLQNAEKQGVAVADAGDLDGDGVSDLLTGLYTQKSTDPGNHVSARAYSGSTGQLLFEVPAPPQSRDSMNAVAGLGDIDRDRRPEFVVGTPGGDVIRVFDAQGTLLKTQAGPPGSDFGVAVASAGNVDASGSPPDIIVGAPAGLEGAGDIGSSVFVYSGVLPATPGLTLIVELTDGLLTSRFGASVGTAGDLGRDGLAEVLVGAPFARSADAPGHFGAVYVFSLQDPERPLLVVRGSTSHDLLGASVDGGVDADGDGVPDFLGGAPSVDVPPPLGSGQTGRGYVRLYSGRDGKLIREIRAPLPGDLFGFSAAWNGPCAGDEGASVVVGAPQGMHPETALPTGRVAVFDAPSGSLRAEIRAAHAWHALGIDVDGFVDLTGDGAAEFLSGASGFSDLPQLWSQGAAFVHSCSEIPRPDVTVDPAPVPFPALAVGDADSRTVEIRNPGTGDLHISSLSLAPGSSPAFGLSGASAPLTLVPGAEATVTVDFAPGAPGLHAGTIRIASNDPDQPVLDVLATGHALAPELTATPVAVDFGAVDVGDATGAVIHVENTGNTLVEVNGIQAPDPAFELALVPPLPSMLDAGESLSFAALFQPAAPGPASTAVAVTSTSSLGPLSPLPVPLSGNGVPPNQPPEAVIEMDVPYETGSDGATVPFRGDESSDPDGVIAAYAWDFGGQGASSAVNPMAFLPCSGAIPCLSVVRLEVTDDGGKSDVTSVIGISWSRSVRSRFWGRIRQGGFDVDAGSVLQAVVNGEVVAETLTQMHEGESVYAIEVPPKTNIASPGGEDGDEVTFRFEGLDAEPTGTWYDATDQELDLEVPFLIELPDDWCISVIEIGNLRICGEASHVPRPGLELEVQEVPMLPIPDPGPYRFVVEPFELAFREHGTDRPIEGFETPYTISLDYTEGQLEAAGVEDETSLQLLVASGGRWRAAGRDAHDPQRNHIQTTLDHASVFALAADGPTPSAPRFLRGDCNGDGPVDVSDAIFLLLHNFAGGREPPCPAACDANGDGEVEGSVTDAVALLDFLFTAGAVPASPWPDCGELVRDTDRALGCAADSLACR